MSETLGLYYIAKAERAPGGIDSTVANSLGKYFISQSSLKNLDDTLVSNIIKVIATNDNVYNLMTQALLSDSKNQSFDYVIDSNNNLVQVFYYKWGNTDDILKKDINFSYSDWYAGTSNSRNDLSGTRILFNFTNYARDWDSFTKIYPNFAFDYGGSYCKVSMSTGQAAWCNLSGATTKITSKPVAFSEAVVSTSATELHGYFEFWHDDHNIYYLLSDYVDSSWGRKTYINIYLNQVTFTNSMKQ